MSFVYFSNGGGKMFRQSGFTLVELLVVVVIIGILAAISLANFVAATKKAKNAAILANMRTIQITSENYSTDSGGAYSPAATGPFLNYLPGGSNSMTGAAGNLPVNPITGTVIVVGDAALTTSAQIKALRPMAPSTGTAAPGSVAYSQADAGLSYAVTGSDVDGLYVPGIGGGTLVLSNQ